MAARATAATAGAALLAALLVPAWAGAAPSPPQIVGSTIVAEAPDFATEVFGDPWDYANPLDQRTDEGPILGSGARGAFGPDDTFVLTAPDGGMLATVFPGFGGAYPAGRDGPRYPVDADRYSHIALRLHVTDPQPAGILFHTCEAANPDCQTLVNVPLVGGWQTLIVDLDASPAWQGRIYALRFLVGDVPGEGRYTIDWVRLYRDTGDVVLSAPPGSQVFWDLDADPGNDTPSNPDWGPVGTANGSGQVRFPAAAYPGGTYRFYARDGSGRSGSSEPLVIDAVPLTVITDPDEQGGEDWAAAATGDPWDMSQPSDASRLQNVKDVSWSGGQLHATNQPQAVGGGQVIGNPIVELRMNGQAIDTARFHRLTVRTDYDGPFSLSFECGGGMHGRLRFWHGDEMHVSRELVLYSDRDTYTWDLRTEPATYVNEDEGYARNHGWFGSPVSRVWWDANEDPCERRWRLDDISIRADDEARGFFGIGLHDPAHQPGTTLTLYRDNDRAGFDGVPIAAGIAQEPGEWTYWWSSYGVPAGTWWLYVEADDGTSVVRRYATGPLVTDGRPRLAGPGRVETAVALSRSSFPVGAPAAVVALDRDFPDALAAAAVASAAEGPTLLNSRDSLHPEVRRELVRLGVTTVYLMGGEVAQSAEVETALTALPGVTVVRLGGASRYHTAALAAERATALWRDAGHATAGRDALLALGTDFPDALSASQVAGHARRPLLLTVADDLPGITLDTLDQLGAERVTIVGGPAAVRESVAGVLRAEGYTVDRLAGDGRYDTAALAAQAAVEAGADRSRVTIAAGTTFPDALGAGPATVADGGVLLLTDGRVVPSATRAWLDATPGATTLKVAGGWAVIGDAVVDELASAAG